MQSTVIFHHSLSFCPGFCKVYFGLLNRRIITLNNAPRGCRLPGGIKEERLIEDGPIGTQVILLLPELNIVAFSYCLVYELFRVLINCVRTNIVLGGKLFH